MDLTGFYTPLDTALSELERRQANKALREKIEEYLGGDVPDHFRNGPLLYLARHIATPSRETLVFLETCEFLPFPAAIGQDINDVFVSHNPIKHALGTLPVSKGTSRNGDPIVEYVTVLDFNASQGCRLRDLQTYAGHPLPQFHNSLFAHVAGPKPLIVDDTEWIDRNHRGDLLEHYKRHLALFLVHGLLFEYFIPQDPYEQRLLSGAVLPAFRFLRETFGVSPLVTPHVSATLDDHRKWDAYPPPVLGTVKTHARPSARCGPRTRRGAIE